MPKYTVQSRDAITGCALPPAVVEAPDGADAADQIARPNISVTLVEAYTPETGPLPTWTEALARHEPARGAEQQAARRAEVSGRFPVLLLGGIWLVTTLLGAFAFSIVVTTMTYFQAGLLPSVMWVGLLNLITLAIAARLRRWHWLGAILTSVLLTILIVEGISVILWILDSFTTGFEIATDVMGVMLACMWMIVLRVHHAGK